MTVEVYKTTFVPYNKRLEDFSDFLTFTERGAEVTVDDVRRLEDEYYTGLTVTEDEYNPYISFKDREDFIKLIGADVYNMLLEEQLDFVILDKNCI